VETKPLEVKGIQAHLADRGLAQKDTPAPCIEEELHEIMPTKHELHVCLSQRLLPPFQRCRDFLISVYSFKDSKRSDPWDNPMESKRFHGL
jgi:hypothetical protein